ncbi:MAG: hypothetical protein IPK16_18040 [Anaerolineales bacterium]|nr:hypothetical protein [Anaerolineales bacterium]
MDIDLGPLEYGPHANLIRDMAMMCYLDRSIQASWVGGSLATGNGDAYSDVDFRIAVEPGQVDSWTNPEWELYLPLRPCGGLMLRFGEQALLHHMILTDGTIVDFYVQDMAAKLPEPQLVILFCRNTAFRETLEQFAQPASALNREIDGAVVRQFFVDYWILTHKEMKALARKYDHFAFTGLYLERIALLRAWYMQAIGKDIDSRVTIHMLGVLHKGLDGKLTEHQHHLLGMPSTTPDETAMVIEAIRDEMSNAGHSLAGRYGFAYPEELEEVVRRTWNANRESVTRR